MATTAIILLAAGNSVRMGQPKQLLDFKGQPLIRHAARVGLDAGVGPVIVVLGANEEPIRAALDGLDVHLNTNPRWPEGMGTSIQAGLREAAKHAPSGVILMLADQPFVSAEFLRKLVDQHMATGKAIVTAAYSGTVGVPVFFARSAIPYLEALRPDQGCKGVILGHPDDALHIDCPQAAIDIDTPGDYAQALEAFR